MNSAQVRYKIDSIAAIATPPGEGGIAIIRLSGPDSLSIASRIFHPNRGGNPAEFAGYSVHYGEFLNSDSESIDDGLITVFRAPHSYTGEDSIELSCHGGRATTGSVLRLVLQAGARMAEPGEFTQRAFLNGKMDLAQAEAVADLIRAQTDSAQRIARSQLEGSLSKKVSMLRQELIGVLAYIEVTIDFSDEVEGLDYKQLETRLKAVRNAVEQLLSTADRGRLMREGLRIAIVGRPNVGKSSLFNALIGEARAIVTAQPGTTRDRLEETVHLSGIPVVLEDLAGIRKTTDMVEQIGVERAESAAASCDVALFVFDAQTGFTDGDRQAMAALESIPSMKRLIIANKSDLIAEDDLASILQRSESEIPAFRHLTVSALNREGLDCLENAILELASGDASSLMFKERQSVVVSSERHRQALEKALSSLNEAERTVLGIMPGDFVAIDTRGALDSLGLITGETVTDEIIHRIFHDFCVGK